MENIDINTDMMDLFNLKEESKYIKVTKSEIVKYWQENKNPYFNEIYFNFDWSDAMDVCWNCGKITKNTQRCHIIPKSLKGSNSKASNFVLLCDQCHREAPNVNDKNAMWDWIKSNKLPFSFYNTYRFQKGMIEFKKKNKISVLIILFELLDGDISDDKTKELLKKYWDNISGHLSTYTISTYLYLCELMYEDYKKKLNTNPSKIKFPSINKINGFNKR